MGERPLGNPYFRDPDVKSFDFNKERFTPIRASSGCNRRLAFVDGGNLELLGAPNFSVQLNRIYACVWKNNSRCSNVLKIPQIEFFSAIYSKMVGEEIVFSTIIVPAASEFSNLLPNPVDLVVRYSERGNDAASTRTDTSHVASMARNFAEWRYAKSLASYLDPGDVIVMDGSLQTQFQNEWRYFRGVEDAAKKNDVVLTSLSKTSTLFTDTGLSLLGAISQFASNSGVEGKWYHPIFESSKHHVFGMIVKLESSSDWVFRLDFQLDQYKNLKDEEKNEILSLFCSNSCDPTFPGYPYGSVDADLFSRVSRDEIDYYRALISSQISALDRQERFLPHVRAGDAHNLLNTIAGF